MKIEHKNNCWRSDCGHWSEPHTCDRTEEECDRCFREGRSLMEFKNDVE